MLPIRLITTLAFAITALIEFSSLGLYFMGTICVFAMLNITLIICLWSRNEIYKSVETCRNHLTQIAHQFKVALRILGASERN